MECGPEARSTDQSVKPWGMRQDINMIICNTICSIVHFSQFIRSFTSVAELELV